MAILELEIYTPAVGISVIAEVQDWASLVEYMEYPIAVTNAGNMSLNKYLNGVGRSVRLKNRLVYIIGDIFITANDDDPSCVVYSAHHLGDFTWKKLKGLG